MTQQFQPVFATDLNTPKLSILEKQALIVTLNAVGSGLGEATVAMTYDKQTKAKPRLPGEDYVSMPGVSPKAQHGVLTSVFRLVDNKANRRKGKVGAVRFRVRSATRGDGVDPQGWTTMIPDGLTSFVVTGFQPKTQQAPVQTPQQGV